MAYLQAYLTFVISMMEYVELCGAMYVYCILAMCQSKKMWKSSRVSYITSLCMKPNQQFGFKSQKSLPNFGKK